MKTVSILLLLFLLFPVISFSQKVTPLEVEIGPVTCWGVKSTSERHDISLGYGGIFEIRYNIYNTDIGIQFLLNDYNYFNGGSDLSINNELKILQAFCDYNFRQGKKINPFVGGGVGTALINIHPSDKYTSICFTPRIGTEFFHHLRLTFDYRFMQDDFSCWYCSLTFVFGGGLIK